MGLPGSVWKSGFRAQKSVRQPASSVHSDDAAARCPGCRVHTEPRRSSPPASGRRQLCKRSSADALNAFINQTLPRTLMASPATLLVLLALFFSGGEAIHAFSIALIVGVIVGTCSSIYVAGSALRASGGRGRDLETDLDAKEE